MEAILALLRNFGAFPVQFYTDYQRAIDGLNRGKAWCCSAKRRDADLWRLIWARYEDLAAEGLVQHMKVKAHTALYRIEAAGPEEKPRLLANRAVDLVARSTANEEWGFLRFADLTKRQKNEAVKGVLNHVAAMGQAAAELASDTTPYEPPPKPPAQPKEARQEHVARVTEVGYGHPVQYAQCVRCWRAFRGPQAHVELMQTACTGHVAQRIVRPSPLSWYISVRGHHLWRSGPYIWCARCGCHSSQKAVGLKDFC